MSFKTIWLLHINESCLQVATPRVVSWSCRAFDTIITFEWVMSSSCRACHTHRQAWWMCVCAEKRLHLPSSRGRRAGGIFPGSSRKKVQCIWIHLYMYVCVKSADLQRTRNGSVHWMQNSFVVSDCWILFSKGVLVYVLSNFSYLDFLDLLQWCPCGSLSLFVSLSLCLSPCRDLSY